MNPNYHIHEQIDRYLNNNLSEDELVQFNKSLLNDTSFKEIFEAQKEAHEMIVDNEMIKLKERMSKDLDNHGDGDSYNWGKTILLTAAISSVAVFSYLLYNNTKPDTIVANQEEIIPTKKEIAVTNINKEITTTEKNNTKTSITSSSLENNNTIGEKQPTVAENNNPVVSPSTENKINTAPVVTEKIIPVPEIKNTIQEHKPVVNCETTVITAEVKVNYNPDDQNEATIIVDKLSVKGGSSPYSFSLNQSAFNNDNTFESVKNGNYHIHIKDKNGCISEIKKEITVKIPQKEIDDAFTPSMGETWSFPIKNNTDATISIINKAGLTVYSSAISGGYPSEWNGRDLNGNELNAGSYYFVVTFANNDLLRGHISIIK